MLENLKIEVCNIAKKAQKDGLCKHKSGNFSVRDKETASCIYTQKGNKKIRKPQAANQTALIFDRRAAARLLSINSIRRLCWS